MLDNAGLVSHRYCRLWLYQQSALCLIRRQCNSQHGVNSSMSVAMVVWILICSLSAAESKDVASLCPENLLNVVESTYLQTRNGSCFHFELSRKRTYSEASKACMKDGGTLALPKFKQLNDYLSDQLVYRYGIFDKVWIGLHDKKEEAKFVWEDNTDLKWHNFALGNGPDNDWLTAGIEDCVAIDAEDDGLWYDYECDSNLNSTTRYNPSKMYICQYTVGKKDPSSDTTKDVATLVGNTCPTAVLGALGPQFLQVWDDTCFYFGVSRRKTYAEANDRCKHEGGTLALPKTKPLNDFLTDQLLHQYGVNEVVWIGLHDWKKDSKFLWEDNSNLDWHNFAKGSGPAYDWLMAGVDDCVAMDPGDDGLWYDKQCDSNLHSKATNSNPRYFFICQYEHEVAPLVEKICPAAVLGALGPQFLQVWDDTCFYFGVSRRKTYTQANDRCKDDGGTLALPKTKPLNDFLTDQLVHRYDVNEVVWIGLRDWKKDSKFVWEDYSNLVWHNFAKGSGPAYDWLIPGIDDCVAMDPGNDGLWHDYQCDSNTLSQTTSTNPRHFFICQYKKDATRTVYNTCPASILGEVGPHFLKVWNTTCFRFVVLSQKTYDEANADCKKDGGTLAMPKTKPINDFLTNQLLNFYGTYQEAWIGLHDKREEAKFVWEDKTELEWHNFAKGSGPDNGWLARRFADCVALKPGDQGLWYDFQCDSTLLSWMSRAKPKKIYICQYTVNDNDE